MALNCIQAEKERLCVGLVSPRQTSYEKHIRSRYTYGVIGGSVGSIKPSGAPWAGFGSSLYGGNGVDLLKDSTVLKACSTTISRCTCSKGRLYRIVCFGQLHP